MRTNFYGTNLAQNRKSKFRKLQWEAAIAKINSAIFFPDFQQL